MKRSLRKISDNTVRRLPKYLRLLSDMEEDGRERVSSMELGDMLGFTSSQVRQDLNNFGDFGRQGYGYNVATLRQGISGVLGMDREYLVVVVGVGNIGRALIENNFFEENGFRVEAAFDVSPKHIGEQINRVRVFNSERMERWLPEMRASVAALCVPKEKAQKTAELLAKLGIRAIWNFTNADLDLKDSGVVVENIHFSDSLLILSYRLSEKNLGQ